MVRHLYALAPRAFGRAVDRKTWCGDLCTDAEGLELADGPPEADRGSGPARILVHPCPPHARAARRGEEGRAGRKHHLFEWAAVPYSGEPDRVASNPFEFR